MSTTSTPTDGGWYDKPFGRFQLTERETEMVDAVGVRVMPVPSETVPFQVQKLRFLEEDEEGRWYGVSGVKPATPLEYELYKLLLG